MERSSGPSGNSLLVPGMAIWYALYLHSHTPIAVTSTSFWIIWAWVPWKGSPSTSGPTSAETPLWTWVPHQDARHFFFLEKQGDGDRSGGGGGKRKKHIHLQVEEECFTWRGLLFKNEFLLNHSNATGRLIMKSVLYHLSSAPNPPRSSNLEQFGMFLLVTTLELVFVKNTEDSLLRGQHGLLPAT